MCSLNNAINLYREEADKEDNKEYMIMKKVNNVNIPLKNTKGNALIYKSEKKADEDRIYSNIKHDSVKASNISRNPRVSFVVDDMIGDWKEGNTRGVSVTGKAELISSGKVWEAGRDLFYEWFPFWKDFLVREDGWSKYILVITPIKVRSWGLT